MKEFKDKVAVITGAASGIGRGLAERCAQEGMKVVLADVEQKALEQAEKELKTSGASILAVLTDVSKAEDVEALASKTIDAFGAIHLLINNAGVTVGGRIWENSVADWEWVLGVNLWGVIHGIRVFVPIMIKHDDECHIVNTASMAGLMSTPFNSAPYMATKHGVVALSETLYHQLHQEGNKIGVSVLCPAFVNTNVMTGDRNRPTNLCNAPDHEKKLEENPLFQPLWDWYCEQIRSGIPCQQVSDCVFDAISENKFYIITHQELMFTVQSRAEDIVQQRNPTNPMPLSELGI